MWVPHKKKEDIIKSSLGRTEETNWREREREETILFLNFPLSFFLGSTKIGPSDFVGINTKSALRDEGYA